MAAQLFEFQWTRGGQCHLATEMRPASAGERVLLGAQQLPVLYIERTGPGVQPYTPVTLAKRLHRDFVRDVVTTEDARLFVERYGFLTVADESGRESVDDILKARVELAGMIGMIDNKWKYGRRTNKAADITGLGKEFNELMPRLRNDSTLPLWPMYNGRSEPRLTIKISLTPERRERLQIVPLTLLSWMWLRVAQEITEGIEWRRCKNPNCDSPDFEVRTVDGRAGREHCGRERCKKAIQRAQDKATKATRKPTKRGAKK